jgi:hypothetical protein
MDAAQQLSRREDVHVVAGDEVDSGHVARRRAARPQRVGALKRDGQRDHRPGRQRHADVSADGGGIPDLERGQECLAALAQQRQCAPFRRAGEPVELRDTAGRCDVEPGGARRERRPTQLLEVDQRIGCDLRLGEQPGAAREPGVAIAPFNDLIGRCRTLHLGDGVEIHAALLPRAYSTAGPAIFVA